MVSNNLQLQQKKLQMYFPSKGFTLIEMMVVVAIIGILAAIAYPNYQKYITRSKRADMMSEMQNIGSIIEAKKLAKGSYTEIKVTDLSIGSFPSGTPLYNVTITPNNGTNLTGSNWMITASPKANTMMVADGTLTLSAEGRKCRASKCGLGKEWSE